MDRRCRSSTSTPLDDAFAPLSGGAAGALARPRERPAGVVTKLDLLEFLAHLPGDEH